MILKRTSDVLFLVRKGHEYKRNTRVCTNMRSLQRMIAFCVQRFLPFRRETSKLCTSHLKSPQPPIQALAGDCGDFHLIYTSFWFPGRRGIHLKSWSSHPLPGYLLAGQRLLCFFHGCKQCFLTAVLRLVLIICFTKGVPCVEKRGLHTLSLAYGAFTF